MNRNVESHFSELPQIDIERSMFDRSFSHKTSFNVGELIPFFLEEVLPGDTFNVKTSCVIRLQTLLTPIMDNMYMDTYFFYVPNRILWTHWKEFMGENTSSAWLPSSEYTVPVTKPPLNGWSVGSIADYMGIPVDISDSESVMKKFPSSLPFRAYAMICDQWFRDQNVSDPLNITLGDSNTTGSNGSNYITDVEKGGKPFKVAKYHDYFTSCLPAPQKGPSVNIFGNSLGMADDPIQAMRFPVRPMEYSNNAGVTIPATWKSVGDSNFSSGNSIGRGSSASSYNIIELTAGGTASVQGILPTNLWADLANLQINVNDLRVAFQLQKFYEKNARAGTRYREILKEHFNITTSDSRMQIPEYLGGHRFPLAIHQVTNQSQSETDFLGDLGAMSNTSDVHEDFIKSFEEHGWIVGVCCVRYDHSYPQGIERFWFRNKRLDYYFPVFANVGEQPVFKSELVWYDDTTGYEVFGYNEAWADYRYRKNLVSSEMRPGIDNSLATWHLSDYYTEQPTLSDGWIREDKSNVDRVLAVTSEVANQIMADFYVKNIATRPMPMYSVPGLIDHH